MHKLQLFSEPFAKTGNIAAEGFKNLLGRPALGLLQTVIRESIQNSVDASLSGVPPEIRIGVRELTGEQRRFLSESVMTLPAVLPESLQYVKEVLERDSLRVLEISDYGTSGLGGPTRADLYKNEEAPDFVNFIRNVGAARDTPHGGGTYGYGKTSLYAMSSCATILVDSVTTYEARPVRRFIGAHLGGAFDGNISGSNYRKRYTGRHWWGVRDDEADIEPIEHDGAELIARMLGLPERDLSMTGTTITILAPWFGGHDMEDVSSELVETLLWNFWPRLTEDTSNERKLNVQLAVDGKVVPVPKPEEFPPLDLFAQALCLARTAGEGSTSVTCGKERRHMGQLAICSGAKAARHGVGTLTGSRFQGQSSLIALMRPVELVVRYEEGEPFPDARYEWAGVFICSSEDEVEKAFANSEPPAHEDWIPDQMPDGKEKTWVRTALRKIRKQAKTYVAPVISPAEGSSQGPSLAETASKLGSVLGQVSTQGPGKQQRKSGGRRSSRDVSVSAAEVTRLYSETDEIIAVFEAELRNASLKKNILLSAEPYLVADGGAASLDDLPDGMAPRVLWMGLSCEETISKVEGSVLDVSGLQGIVNIGVRISPEAAAGLKLYLRGDA